MNELEKRSFYSFLGLYIVSSFLFILLAGFWYYTAQKHAFENNEHYRLEHIADRIGTAIIMAHMHGTPLQIPALHGGDVRIALIGTDGRLVSGELPPALVPDGPDYREYGGRMVLVSDAPKEHLSIRYVVVSSDALFGVLAELREVVLAMMAAIALLAATVAWTLSKLFMRPLHQRVVQTERFVSDVTHELNTPITALSMAAEHLLQAGRCSEKTLRNITASTRQLYDIYRSLTYLNFARKTETPHAIDLAKVAQKSADYYRPLMESKQQRLLLKTHTLYIAIPEAEAQLLLGNLIGNAVKYSPAGATVQLEMDDNCIIVVDEGMGIAPEQQRRIFEQFTRATDIGGGFGVGLSIVKRICDAYGVALALDSEEGKGTRFRLCFPQGEAKQ
ncbi:HAMP domain-containing histidine kinase [Sulfurimonas sp. HSL-3221]|uniref:sensor histidine kinase n=1 Tax=Sulfurimonadaceae TaxID=2771471 RepID=UPI001E542CC0|nr:HAMP domain-containing sensor histidine kinase [Sulfurimonas sp. HSL-3221]UFS62864.1 HAMP domain-containing histidine kinase [Sulfurimonas sp. HSL-3221]